MRNQFNEIMQKLRAQRVRARRYTAMLLVLAMLTSLSVSWRLHQVGTALTTDNEYCCGMEEHVHTDDCYTEELVCGYEEGQPEDPDSAFSVDSEPTIEEPEETEPEEPEPEETEPEVHHHTADCYETVLVEHKELTCGQEEHIHDDTCPVDPDTGEFLCGYEEHEHSDDCFTTETETEEKLICGYEEGQVLSDGTAADDDGIAALEDTNTATSVADDSSSEAVSEPVLHHHTEACYEKVLTCTIPEHTHTLECLADYSADVETDDDWEKYSVGLSDNWNEALLAVAQEQLGYKESEKNFQTDEALGDIIDVHHYTRYGAFYGNPYADWDVAFIAFCQHYAGIPKTEIPQRLGLEALRADMDAMGFAYLTEGEDAAYEAIPGDVVTYNKNGTADDETIGIVETVGDDSLTVISGAVEGAVAEVTVPFTDVTSTILVDQAYGDYVGEADDRDGSHDDEIAVQPADEKGATAVYASEDIFNIIGALDLNDETNQKNLDLTFTLEKKPDGKNWAEIPAGSEIQEGDEVRLVLNMGSVPENTFHDGQNGNKAYYRLPYKLAEPLTDKPIYKEGSTTEVIGHLNVNPEGLAIITFDKVQGFDYTKAFKATINVSGKIVASGTGTSEDIKFSNDAHFTLKKKSDIKTEKSAAAEVVEKGDRTYFKYTVKVSSKNGTAGQPVTIDDVITNLYNLTGSYNKESFTLTKNGTDSVSLNEKITFAKNSEGKDTFEIKDLDALGQDEYYELTYLYEVRYSGKYDNKWGAVDNTAKATSGENESTATANKSLSSDDITVEKTGKINGNYQSDKSLGKIAWTVTINNPNGRDLKDYVVNDALKTSGITIRAGDKVKIEESTDSNNFHDFKVNGIQQYGVIKEGNTGFTYKFPEGSTGKKYRFTYYTTMPDGTGGKDVTNGVDVTKGENTYHAEYTVQNAVRDLLLLKNSSGKLETVSTGKMQEKKWSIAVRTAASVGKKSSFTVTDTFQKPTIGGVEATGLKHYAVKNELDTQLKNGMKLYWVSGENSGSAKYSELTKPEYSGVKIDITYYGADGNEVTEDTDEVTSFKIMVDWTNATNENLVITQLNAEPYSSYVEDVSSLNAGQTLTVTNQIEYEGDHVSAKSEYTKPAAGNPQLVKRASGNVHSGFNESASVEYGKVIWFKLILKNMTDNTVTVTDTLPEGLKFDPNDNTIGEGSPYYVGFSMNDGDGINASSCLVPLDGTDGSQVSSRQGVGYLTVSAADYKQGKKQQVTFELKNLNNAQANNTKNKPIAIIFGVRVDDDRWEDINFTQDTYTNTATWDKDEKEKTADVTVKRTDFGLWKTAKPSSDKNAATYTVEINKDGKQWLSTPGSELELHDTLTIPAEIDAEIIRKSVKLEKYVDWNWVDATTTDLRRFTLEPMQIDGTNKVYKMTFTVPDSCHYKLTYEYRFLVGSSLGTQQFEISNKVDMFGHGESKSDYQYRYVEGGGTASQKNTNTLQLLKVERNKYNNTLPGATFKLSKRVGSGWSAVKNDCTTDTNGQILFRYANQVSGNVVKVERGVLYRLEEIAAPNGYIGDSTPHYFLMLDANQTKEDAAITTAMQGSGVAESQITFVAANQTEQMYVENTAKQITIRKVWQDANGRQETNVSHGDITVKLTRTDKATGQVDTSWSADITLSSSNNWTYIYPDTSKTPTPDDPLDDNYTYAVEETNKPDNYNVSYTDQNGNEQHTGFTSGDTVVIKNMQKSGWLKVEKKWLAEDGKTALKDADLPESITVQLYKVNDSGVGEKVEGKTLKLNAGNYWKGQFTGLEEDAQYYVVEDPQVAGFKVTYSHTDLNAAPTGSTVTVTNTKKRTETTLDVVKMWQDSDCNPLTENLPTEITLILYEKGTNQEVAREKVKPDADGNWKYTFTGLEPEKEYYVEEVSVDGYEVVSGTGEGNAALPGATIVVTNRKNAPGYELPATGSTGTAPYTTAGAVLMGAALVGGYRRKRRQERRGE